jgi:hypothetical protein
VVAVSVEDDHPVTVVEAEEVAHTERC